MSQKDSSKGEPIEPEIVQEDESTGGVRRLEREAVARPTTLDVIFENLFRSPKREARQAREWADAFRAQAELDEALGDLAGSRAKLKDSSTIIATDNERRQTELMRAKNEKAEEERIARLKELQDQLSEEEIRAKIAEARRRRQQAENPAPPPDEDAQRREAVAKKFREHMGRRFTEQEVRAHADQLIAEIKARAGGEITPAIQREIDNVTDIRDKLLDEL